MKITSKQKPKKMGDGNTQRLTRARKVLLRAKNMSVLKCLIMVKAKLCMVTFAVSESLNCKKKCTVRTTTMRNTLESLETSYIT